jgi:hypothetical protein
MEPDNTAFSINAFAINYDNAWKPFSISDPAVLHATLSLVAQHSSILYSSTLPTENSSGESSDLLFHKGKTMGFLNQRLRERAGGKEKMVDEGNITIVIMLVILEAIDGTFEGATVHRDGLLKMVRMYGGVERLWGNPVLLRVLAW